jgi:hypothetical protein
MHWIFRVSKVPSVFVFVCMVLPSCGHVCENIPVDYELVPGIYTVEDNAADPRLNGATVVVTDGTLRIEYTGDDDQPHFALYSYSPADTGTP